MDFYWNEVNRCILKYLNVIEQLEDKTVMITGASGMIGKCIIDILMTYNEEREKINIIALSRNEKLAYKRLSKYWNSEFFCYKKCDVTKRIPKFGNVDYIIHAADDYNNGLDSFTCSIDGLRNLVSYAQKHKIQKICFLSTDEVYGECGLKRCTEDDVGVFDCFQYRSIFTEGKRAAEAFLKHYGEKSQLMYVICRISKCYGDTIHEKNKKIIHQFIYRAAGNDVIQLKSSGTQKFSFIYVTDVACGILISMIIGKPREIYNISSEKNELTVKELARKFSLYTETKGNIVQAFSESENRNFTTVQQLVTSSKKLEKLGWTSRVTLEKGIESCIKTVRAKLDENMEKTYNMIKSLLKTTLDDPELTLVEKRVKLVKIPVWICWWQGENKMPELVQCCFESVKRNFPVEKVQIITITEDNYLDFVTLSDDVIVKYKQGIITKTHLSDILRAELLYRYGGWWLDATIFVTKKISDSFFERKTLFTLKRKNHYTNGDISRGMYAGFIWYVPYKRNKLFSFLTKAFINYWRENNQLIEYFLINYIIAIAIDSFPEIRKEIETCECTEIINAGTLQTVLNNSYDELKWKEYINEMSFYKMQRRFLIYEKDANGNKTFWGHIKDIYLNSR